MIKNLIFILFISMPMISMGQSFWTKTKVSDIAARSGEERSIIPTKYETFSLDQPALEQYLSSAPLESDPNRKAKELTLAIPMPNGQLEMFKVFESPVMDKGISAKYPSIKSYKAYHAADRHKVMRFSVSPYGFHAAINAIDGEKYIDPFSDKNKVDYIVYNTKDHQSEAYAGMDLCGVDDTNRPTPQTFRPNLRSAGEVELRVYKLAMACTGEWGMRRGTVEKCLADINTMTNRMNLIYENEMAMRFVIIDDNDKLINLDPETDNYQNSDEGKKIVGLNTSKLNEKIPADSYDIGHVLSVCFDIGGVAQLGSACQSNKGNGVTCNNNNDLSSIVTRVMAHEVGHQLDASHTWNICTSAADQRAPGTAFEPGSGTTIMSYAGTCGTDNVANDNDAYFHVGSLDQMYTKTLAGGNAYDCADKVATGNHFPVITMPTNAYVIPVSTPFELTATVEDEDNDALTYVWEQYDTGELVTLGSSSSMAPLFRSIKPSTNTTRFFPNAANILNGVLNEKTEVLPTNSRDLNFRFTVRDNNPAGSGVQWGDYRIKSTSAAGPFSMIFPLLDNKFKIGQEIEVTWNVAKTNLAPVNCQKVNIYASVSGALITGDPNLIPLALNVPNDGAQKVYIPNRTSNFVKIVIKAADHIFLTTSSLNSKIEEPTQPTVFFGTNQGYLKACQPDDAIFEFETAGLAGLTGDIQFEIISGLPQGAVANFSNTSVAPGQSTTLTVDTKNIAGSQDADILIRAFVPGVDTMDRIVTLSVQGDDVNDIETTGPADGSSGVLALPTYSWNKKLDATSYEVQVSTSPDFAAANIITSRVLTDSTFTSSTILEKATIYYWRVRAKNDCLDGLWSDISAFITEALSCNVYASGIQTVNISGSGMPTVELGVTVPSEGSASDINVNSIVAEHAASGDLTVFLVAPSGNEVLLWSGKCGTSKNINVGVDDQAPSFFQCPINTGNVYRPESPLSALNGESIKGEWKIRVEDRKSGNGGKLQELNLEICSNIVLDQPYLVKNETLNIYPTNKSFITDALLLAQDNNNTAAELTYTLVAAPGEGILTFNGTQITAGATFTQLEINQSKLRYESTADTEGTDAFTFTVQDGQGGWISITKFNIVRDLGVINAVSDVNIASDVFVQPNPTTDLIEVVLTGDAKTFNQYVLTDMAGKLLLQGRLLSEKSSLSLDNMNKGIYFLKLSNGRQIVTKKIVKL